MKRSTDNNNPCTICRAPGIPGLFRGAGKCAWHWVVGVWGEAWAKTLRDRGEL
jgi:hypothetical protein